jgi:lipopolysaccharide/colanic/teichoic acid biosynthesis glycosyltransferase
MQEYIEYVHNLIGTALFDHLNKKTQEAVVSTLKHNFPSYNDLEKAILSESNPQVFQYIREHLDLNNYFRHIVFSTVSRSYVEDVDFNNVRAIINFKKINHIRYINEHFRSVNKLLPYGGLYIGRLEKYWERKKRFYKVFGKTLGQIIWLMDFVVNRVIPRLNYIEKVYAYFTSGAHHTISQAEVLGRLVYCGFEIIDYTIIDGLSYFVVMKAREPQYDKSPSFHPIIKLNRIGKNARMIGVYKIRTMHPYAEYLQDFVLNLSGYNSVGKPESDFRVTRWGRFFRKYWIDEIPQIINILKGEMKLVGLRPLSRVRFDDFPEDLKRERIKYKPGCIAPYVALKMPDDKMNIEAERIYIKDLKRHPYLTDFKYFFKALYNIITNKITSS